MSVITGSDYYVYDYGGLTLDHPILGWINSIGGSGIVADFTAPGFPAINVRNPATNLWWASNSLATQYLTMNLPSAGFLNFVGICRHNFAEGNITVSVETDNGSGTFVQKTTPVVPPAGPIILRWGLQSLTRLRIKMVPGTINPSIAVVYHGLLTTIERKIYQGHTPLNHWNDWKVTNNMAEAAHFAGRIVLSRSFKTKMDFKLISPEFWRNSMYSTIYFYGHQPMFHAWRPQTYPAETGYSWLTAMPIPVPQSPTNLISFTLDMNGLFY